jgi:Na+/melibiose symporter-like transporter
VANETQRKKYIPTQEFIIFLASTFLFTNMTGMAGNFRQKYLVDVLGLPSTSVATINFIAVIAGYALSFCYVLLVDRAPKPGKPKFKPFVLMSAVPAGIFAILMFFVPSFLTGLSVSFMVVYQITITILHNTSHYFAGQVNQMAIVMSPDLHERDNVLSYRSMLNAIGNSAPLVVVLVIGLFIKDDNGMMYLVSASICAVASSLMLVVAMRFVKERIAYSPKKINPLLGFRDIVKNKYALLVLISEFIKGFRSIATYMAVFLSAALLGKDNLYILFGLPTGVGTFVGMLIVKFLLKKLNSKQIYMLSGCYSMIANICLFAAGVLSFAHPDVPAFTIVFFVFLFGIGLQYGASNLLPTMFQADILEDLEVKSHKRLEASLAFTIGTGTQISTAIGQAIAPLILYGDTALNFIHYVQQTVGEGYLPQSDETKVRLLGVFSLLQGACMLLCCVPFLFYKLTGEKKQQVHEEVLAYRASLEATQE